MTGFDGVDPTNLKEMTEVEMANSLSADEIVKLNIHFKDPKARMIALAKVCNDVKRLSNEIQDKMMVKPKPKWYSFILRMLK